MGQQANEGDTRAALIVAVQEWEDEDGPFERLVEIERCDQDEVKVEIRSTEGDGTNIYLSRAAAEELGKQMLKAATKEWGS
jgi:hypothetical protein